MRRIGIAPKVMEILRAVPAIDSWFNTITERWHMYRGAANPTAAELPENQWALWKNTTTGARRFWVNDAGVPTEVGGSSTGFGHRFSAYRDNATGTQTIAISTTAKLMFDAENYDTASAFDTTTSRWTAPDTCIMNIHCRIQVQGTGWGQNTYISLYKNGAEFARGTITTLTGGNLNHGSIREDISLVNGDYVEAFLTTGSTSSQIVNQTFLLSAFTGHQVG